MRNVESDAADVVLMFFDASETISKVDKQLMGYVMENHKPCIFRDQQMGQVAWIRRNGSLGHLFASPVPHVVLRTYRIHYRPDRKECQNPAESCDHAVQTVARTGFNGGVESVDQGCHGGT